MRWEKVSVPPMITPSASIQRITPMMRSLGRDGREHEDDAMPAARMRVCGAPLWALSARRKGMGTFKRERPTVQSELLLAVQIQS